MHKSIKLHLGPESYSVHIENGLLGKSARWIRASSSAKRFVILSVPGVFRKYGKSIQENLKKIGASSKVISIPDGEGHKNEKTLFFILRKMGQSGLRRDSGLITLGGGVVGDLVGLAASLYMRGIDYIQCPTTLLSQVDASIGGKTAIDFLGVKNLVGTFYQPKTVLIDPTVLKTLSGRQFRTGLAEVIKCGVIQDAGLFGEIEKQLPLILERNGKILNSIIAKSCRIKSDIVTQDEKETGVRAWLNYGHTLGHALESYFDYKKLTHGEAVAYGMWFAAILSDRLGFCSEAEVARQRELLKRAGLFAPIPRFDVKKVCEKMFLDKKARNGRIQFVLTRKIGLVSIQKNVPQPVILSALNQLQAEASELY